MTTTDQIKLLQALVEPALFRPGSLRINSTHLGPNQTELQIQVHGEDMPKIIGKAGLNIMALKVLMREAGAANNQIIQIRVEEPAPVPEHTGTPWTMERVKDAICGLMVACRQPAEVEILPHVPRVHMVAITPPPTEQIHIALERWLRVMGSPGDTQLILDAADPA